MSKKDIVSRDFIDKNTMEYYQKDKHEYPHSGEATDERKAELRELGVLYPPQPAANDLTVQELKDKLDAKGVEYSDKAKKPELVELYEKEGPAPQEVDKE